MGQWEHAARSQDLASLLTTGQPQFLSSIMSHVSLKRAASKASILNGVFAIRFYQESTRGIIDRVV